MGSQLRMSEQPAVGTRIRKSSTLLQKAGGPRARYGTVT
jgi:hypothetical protein